MKTTPVELSWDELCLLTKMADSYTTKLEKDIEFYKELDLPNTAQAQKLELGKVYVLWGKLRKEKEKIEK